MISFALNQVDVSAPRGFINSITTQSTTALNDCVLVAFLNDNACVRIDQHDLPVDWVEMLEALMNTATDSGVEQVIITVFGTKGEGRLPFAQEVKDIKDTLDAAQIHLLDLLFVQGNHYWSYMCEDLDCCPSEGNVLQAEVRELAPPPADVTPEIVVLSVADIRAICEQFEGRVHESANLTWTALQALTEPYSVTVEVRNQHQKEVIAGVQNIKVRDWMMCQIIQGEEQEQALLDALLECVKVAPKGHQARIAAVGAMLLKASDADHNAIWAMLDLSCEESLGRLVQTAVTHNVPSRVARDSITAVIDTCNEGVQDIAEAS